MYDFLYIFNSKTRQIKNEKILKIVVKSGEYPPEHAFTNTKDADIFKEKFIKSQVEQAQTKIKGIQNFITKIIAGK